MYLSIVLTNAALVSRHNFIFIDEYISMVLFLIRVRPCPEPADHFSVLGVLYDPFM